MTRSVYPNELDSDLELPRVDDNITEIGGDVINSLRDAIIALEAAVGLNPQGAAASLSERINRAIDESGNIRSSALAGSGLVSLPIDNSQISDDAAIQEFKLDLDFGTSFLNSRINSFNADIDSLRTTLSSASNQSTLHYVGAGDRHDGYDIDVIESIRGGEDVESVLHLINNAFTEHQDLATAAHAATAISVVNEFRSMSANNVQEALISLDEISVATLSQNQDELRGTGITINNKGQKGKQGNLPETLFASTIFNTDILSTTNILQVMRPNTTRVTSRNMNLRALSIGAFQNLRIEAGGIDRAPIDINLSSAISTDNVDDIVYVINTQCSAVHYPVSAYNTSGHLTIAHNIPGKEFTIQIKDDVALSAHVALGFADITSTVFEWADNNYSAFINGTRVTDMKSLVKVYHTHAGGSTISLGLGDLSLLGLDTGNEGRILCHITNHDSDSTYNGTYYITGFPTSSTFQLADGDESPISIPAGKFDLEIAADSVNFNNSTNGEIYDIFAEASSDGYCLVTKANRASYGYLTNVTIRALSKDFPTDIIWQITDANQIKFIVDNNIDGAPVTIPTGYIGQLKVFAPDNYNFALFEITGNPASGTRDITVFDFTGSNEKLYLSSVHYAGTFGIKTLKFVTDRRNFGGTPENFTNDVFSKTRNEEIIDDLRSNGIVRGFDLLSTTDSSLLVRGGRAYVDGRAVDVDTQTVTVNDFSPSKKLLLLDRSGSFFIKSEFDSGYSFADLIEGDSYGDNRGFATILEFETDGLAIVDGYGQDRRLFISNIDKRVNDAVRDLHDRVNQVQNVVSGSFWGQVQSSTTDNALVATLGISSNTNFTALDQTGFSAGNNLITSRRFEFTSGSVTKNDVFGAAGLTHVNIFVELQYSGVTTGPFGTSGSLQVYVGTGIRVGLTGDQTTYEDYALVKTIDDDVLPSNIVTERYVASIPITSLVSSNIIFDILPRIKVTGSTYADGGDGPDPSPKIEFYNVRVVTSSYSIAGNITGEDGSSQVLATTVGNVL